MSALDDFSDEHAFGPDGSDGLDDPEGYGFAGEQDLASIRLPRGLDFEYPDVASLGDLYRDCTLCPRQCHVDRTRGQLGYCGASSEVKVARAALHFWEEPPISGDNGSGTVFFAHCQLQCVYCQNHEISRRRIDPASGEWARREVSADKLADIYLSLQGQGANNVNLVSATQYVPTVIESVLLARERGLEIPVVYNSGGYESTSTLKLLHGIVDIYLVDMKHLDPEASSRYCNAPDYPPVVLCAVREMVSQTGSPCYGVMPTGEEVMTSGTIVRHLLLPGRLEDAEEIVSHLAFEYGDRVVVSLMSQYVPTPDALAFPELRSRVDASEYENLVDYASLIEFDECFIQETDSADDSYIPRFDGTGVWR